MKVKAAVLRQVGQPLTIEEIELKEKPLAGEVRIRMVAVGACRSDFGVMSGETKHNLPVVVGHEGAGLVEEVGEGVRLKVGEQVVLNWAPSCGNRCEPCLDSHPNLCVTYVDQMNEGTMMNGTTRLSSNGETIYRYSGLGCLIEKLVVDEACCIPIPKEVPAEVAALIGCAVSTGIGAALNTVAIKQGQSVAVFGLGGVGLSTVLGAKLAGASQIIAIDQSLSKKELSQNLGATDFIAASSNAQKVIQEILALTKNKGVDFAFEATGLVAVQQQCVAILKRGGSAVLLGLSPMGTTAPLPTDRIVRNGFKVIGSYYGDVQAARDFPLYAKLYLQGKLDLDGLVTKRFQGLEKVGEAYEAMRRGDVGRAVILI